MSYITQAHLKVVEVSVDYNPSELTDVHIIACDTTTAPLTVTISTEDIQNVVSGVYRQIVVLDKGGNVGNNPITIQLENGGTINGSASVQISGNYNAFKVVLDGTNGVII